MNRASRLHSGFTYIGILLAVALLGTSLAALGTSWSLQKRRMAEQDLITVGRAYRQAIARYYNATPRGAHEYPTSLSDLVSDQRGQAIARHLRELYPDPLTGTTDWQLITAVGGSIIGIASQDDRRPLKRAKFGLWEATFENAGSYSDWQFVYLPQLVGESESAN